MRCNAAKGQVIKTLKMDLADAKSAQAKTEAYEHKENDMKTFQCPKMGAWTSDRSVCQDNCRMHKSPSSHVM